VVVTNKIHNRSMLIMAIIANVFLGWVSYVRGKRGNMSIHEAEQRGIHAAIERDEEENHVE
jgi:hypothetical protein